MARNSSKGKTEKPVVIFCDCKPEDLQVIGTTGAMRFCSKHSSIRNIINGAQSVMELNFLRDEVLGRKQ